MKRNPKLLPSDGVNVYDGVNFERASHMLQLARFGHDDLAPRSLHDKKELLGYRFEDVYTDDEHCRIYHNDHEVIVMFEGSDSQKNSHHSRNLDHGRRHPFKIGTPKMEKSEFGGDCRVHPGFAKAMRKPTTDSKEASLGFQEVIAERIKDITQHHPEMKVNLVGYSAGGAFAGIMASHLAVQHPELHLGDIYTFAAPRYCGKNFAAKLEGSLEGDYLRFEMLKDPVPAWARYDAEYYVHPGRQVVITRDGKLVQPCIATGHSSDSYSEAIYAAIDLSLHKIHRPMVFMPHYHSLYHYSGALDTLAAQQREDHSQPVLNPIHLNQRTLYRMDSIQKTAGDWFDEVSEVVGRHIARVSLDSPETGKQLQEKLNYFNLAASSQHDPFNNPSWLGDSFNTLTDLYQALDEKAPLSSAQMMIFARGILGLERTLEPGRKPLEPAFQR